MAIKRSIRKKRSRVRWLLLPLWILLLAASVTPVHGKERADAAKVSLDRYLRSLIASEQATAPVKTTGSLWIDQSPLAMIANDAKAKRLHDLITIAVSEQTLAQASGDVTAQRNYSSNSAISALGGHISTGGVNPLFSAASTSSLKGKGQSDSNSVLRTTLAGEIVAVLPNGNMVVEARRAVTMNNEHRTFVLRGVVRPADIGPNNVVNSAAVAHLEIELKGKGVVSDGTRPNNVGIRWLWKVLGF